MLRCTNEQLTKYERSQKLPSLDSPANIASLSLTHTHPSHEFYLLLYLINFFLYILPMPFAFLVKFNTLEKNILKHFKLLYMHTDTLSWTYLNKFYLKCLKYWKFNNQVWISKWSLSFYWFSCCLFMHKDTAFFNSKAWVLSKIQLLELFPLLLVLNI